MKKSLSLFAKALTLFVAFSFVGCSDDDKESNNDNNNQTIVGSWVYTGYYTENGTYVADEPTSCESFTVTFNANGTGNDIDKDCEAGDDTNNFTWTSEGNNNYKLTYPEFDSSVINIAFLSNNQIDVTFEDGSKEKFTKK